MIIRSHAPQDPYERSERIFFVAEGLSFCRVRSMMTENRSDLTNDTRNDSNKWIEENGGVRLMDCR